MAAAGDTIFIFGGITIDGYSDELWMFDSGSSSYTLLKTFGHVPKTARGSCKAYLERDEAIFETYLGETTAGISLSSIYRYGLPRNLWTVIKKQAIDNLRLKLGVTLYLQDKLLVAGGAYWQYFVYSEIIIYDQNTNRSTVLDQTLPHEVYNAARVYYKNKVYIHGGSASFRNLPLPDIPMNNLIIINLDDDCEASPSLCRANCSPGTYYNNNDCIPCPVGSYQDQLGAKDCKKCPAGFYSDTEGSDSLRFCKPCSIGTFNTLEGETMCYNCPAGSECTLNKLESAQLAAQMKKTISNQPNLYHNKEEEV